MRNAMNAVIAAMILVCGTAAAQSLGQIAVFHEKVGWNRPRRRQRRRR